MRNLRSILFPLLLVVAVHAGPAGDDPRLKEILDIPNEQVFTGRFCRLLLEIPAAGFRGFRETLYQGLDAETLPSRHTWKALGLADMRWGEIDSAGFIAACREGKLRITTVGKQQAVLRLAESDVAAAIALFRELGLDNSYGPCTQLLLAVIAARDLPRAIAVFKELPENQRSSDNATALVRGRAEKDPEAVWREIESISGREDVKQVLRAEVCVAAARKDPALALRLAESVDPADSRRSGVQRSMISKLGSRAPDLALDLARRLNTPEIWMRFAASARYGTDEETLRHLLEVLPKEIEERCLKGFFTWNDDPVLPSFPHARLLPILPDKELRRAIIVAIAGVDPEYQHPLPAAVVAAALEVGPKFLFEKSPVVAQRRLLGEMLKRDAEVVLPWLLTLRETEWKEIASDTTRFWPESRLAEDAKRFLASGNPRELALGMGLIERWWHKDPVGAFPHVREKRGDLPAYRMNCEKFVKACGGDAKRAEAMLTSIADPKARRIALEHFKIWSMEHMTAPEILDLVLELLKQPEIRDMVQVCQPVIDHVDPKVDDLIAAIPDSRLADRDKLLGLRASHLMVNGEQERAIELWRQVRDDRSLMASFRKFIDHGGSDKVKDWESLIELVTARPASKERTSVIEEFSRSVVRYAQAQGLTIAAKTSCAEMRRRVLIDLAGKISDSKLYAAGMELVQGLPRNAENAELHAAWQEAGSRLDPASGWQQAVELGLDAAEGMQLGRASIERMARLDAKSALALLMKSGPLALRQEFLKPVAQGLIEKDPAAAFRAGLLMPPDLARDILHSAASGWAAKDHVAACQVSLEIGQPAWRDSLFHAGLRAWLPADENAALAWIKGLENPDLRLAGLRMSIGFTASANPVKAAALYLEARPEDPEGLLAASIAKAWAERDSVKACRFLIQASGETGSDNLKASWQEILTKWFEVDPESAATFLVSLERSPVIDSLNSGMVALLLPRYKDQLTDWKHPPSRIDLSSLDEADHHLDIKALAAKNPGETQGAVLAMKPGFRKSRALHELLEFVLKAGDNERIVTLLDALAEMPNETSPIPRHPHPQPPVIPQNQPIPKPRGTADVASAVGKVLAHHLTNSPEKIRPFVKVLAIKYPDLLSNVAMQLAATWSEQPQHRAAIISVLALLPENERLRVVGNMILVNKTGVAELADAIIEPDADKSPIAAHLAAVNDALLGQNLAVTLQAAMQLPCPDYDPLVCRIIAAFPTRAAVDSAVNAIPEAAARLRAREWLEALGLVFDSAIDESNQ